MDTHFHPPADPFGRPFPSLPIVTPDPPRKTDREKYRALFYLGSAGLVVVVALVGWFASQAWAMRDIWKNVYILHDAQRPEVERVQAAYSLALDPRATPRQLWEIALRRPLPALARYVVAEGIGASLVADDPRGYASAVALSEGWPGWLRVVLTRPLAFAAVEGIAVPSESLEVLGRDADAVVALWAEFALAASPDRNANAASALRAVAASDDPNRDLAVLLVKGLDSSAKSERLEALRAATIWLRAHHPEAAPLWRDWKVSGDRLVPERVEGPLESR